MAVRLEFSFLSNKEKFLLMMAPPIYEELSPCKTEILDNRSLRGETGKTIRTVADEIDRIIKNRGKGYPKRMKKPANKPRIVHSSS